MKRNRSKGFTLLELLIALAIFAIGILGMVKMQIAATKGNSSARTVTEATTVGQDLLERLILLPYTHADLADTDGDGTGFDDTPADGVYDADGTDTAANFGLDDRSDPAVEPNIDLAADHQTVVTVQGVDYTLTWNIAEDEPIDGTKQIKAFVSWETVYGGDREISLSVVKVSI
ncbi:MAG: prepilin-type N-terminal cleavage/methylation domain-containing protein [Desulfobacteraceae bacterium]|nr:MAG: prepilin-type N-terminal cleavage/methylation domain-containing protein [Desulfobacteraceae bacterium]